MKISGTNPTPHRPSQDLPSLGRLVQAATAVGKPPQRSETVNSLPGEAGQSPSGERAEQREPLLDPETVRQALEEVNENINFLNRRLEFRVHESTNRIMVRVIDRETDRVIKEIPPEKLLDMAAKLQELVGLLVDERA